MRRSTEWKFYLETRRRRTFLFPRNREFSMLLSEKSRVLAKFDGRSFPKLLLIRFSLLFTLHRLRFGETCRFQRSREYDAYARREKIRVDEFNAADN